MMNEEFRQLILKNLAVVIDPSTGDLVQSLKELDEAKSLTTGHLAHYLSKRSYQKAWDLLHDETPEKGTCS
jgi:hypothetical protein